MAEKDKDITLRIARTFQSPREKVFRAWTDPEQLSRWFSPNDQMTCVAQADARAGGAYRLSMREPDGKTHNVFGIYWEVIPPEKLVFTWKWEEHPEMEDTLVTLEFLDRGGATELVLVHERLPDEKMRDEHKKGWNGCLDRLAKYV